MIGITIYLKMGAVMSFHAEKELPPGEYT